MSYIVFARKYRPKTFDEIIGQPHIAKTLKNAILHNRVAHAYLFSGPRGVGKTTTARILAKALNCEKGPTPEPCNSCALCKEINQGTNLDILEIDGASNRGIDEIRNLKENTRFAPSKGRLKVYIIDEVHMLTPEAFNALLKTLEEPPAHVKFIFATTQVQKVPPTILSRCQRFDFRRIATKDIAANLASIAKQEKLDVKDESLGMIARYADGSMRDGQVILDQIIAFSQGTTVGREDVESALGIVEEDALFDLASHIAKKDPASALRAIDRLIREGKDAAQITIGLIEHFRNLCVVKVTRDVEGLIEAGADRIKRYETQANAFNVEELLYAAYTLSNTLELIKKTNLVRIPLEINVIKLTKRSSIIPVEEMLEKIKSLENRGATSKEIASSPSKTGTVQKVPPHDSGLAPKGPSLAFSEEPPVSPVATATTGAIDMEDLLGSWAAIINNIKTKKISIGSYLAEGSPIKIEGMKILIGFPKEFKFHKEVLESPENKKLIEGAIKEVLGAEYRANLIITEDARTTSAAAKSDEVAGEDDRNPQGQDSSDSKKELDPIIENALEIFNGNVAGRQASRERGAK